jgi:hypothetical protein
VTVRPGEVRRRVHRAEVRLSGIVLEGNAGQLAVGNVDPKRAHHLVHALQGVGADLMAEPARPGVHHHADLSDEQPHRVRGVVVEHLLDHLDLEEVVPGAEASELRGAAVDGAIGDMLGTRVLQYAAVLGELGVLLPTKPPG